MLSPFCKGEFYFSAFLPECQYLPDSTAFGFLDAVLGEGEGVVGLVSRLDGIAVDNVTLAKR